MNSSESNLKRTSSTPVQREEKRVSMKPPLTFNSYSYDSKERNVKFNNVSERTFKPKLQRMPTPYANDDYQEENSKRLVRQQNVRMHDQKLSEIPDEEFLQTENN